MSAIPWNGDLPASLRERFGAQVLEASSYLDQNFLRVEPAAVLPIIEHLHQHHGFDYLVDITAVDHPARAERFELVYILYSYASNQRLRLHANIAEGVEQPTATGVFVGANWIEREVFDMFGIRFRGHPDLKRILLPDGWEGFPLRKDYPILQQDQQWVQQNLGIESGQ